MTITTTYAEYVTELAYDDLPEEVVDYAKKLTLDAIGVSVGARSRAGSSDAFVDGVDSLADGGEATVFATGETLEPEYAALLNGALVHSLDYDDTHRGASHHPGASVIPAAIATAETVERDVGGEELLAAIVAGYEVNCRLGQAVDPASHYDRGFHITATCGTFAATAAAGKIAGLDAGGLANAFGLNGSQAAGSQQYLANGSWNKRAHPGLAAHSGILAARFAEAGFYGSEAPIEGEDGFLNAYSDDPKPELATEGLGEEYELYRTGIKPYPCCRYMHAPLDGVFGILEEASIAPEDIESATVEIADPGIELVGRPAERKENPQSFVDAQFSMPFGVALAAVAGEATVDSFIEWSDGYTEEFGRIMRTTDVRSSAAVNEAYPEMWCADVTIETAGKTFETHVEYANGEPENRMSWDDVTEKYGDLTVDLPSAAADEFLERVRSLEDERVEELTAPLLAESRNEAVADD